MSYMLESCWKFVMYMDVKCLPNVLCMVYCDCIYAETDQAIAMFCFITKPTRILCCQVISNN